MGTTNSASSGRLSPVAFQILLALAGNDLHGYGIKLEVERRTDGTMNLGSGTLYEAIQRLEAAGHIATCDSPLDAPSGARKRRYYRIEDTGREALEAELARMERIVRYARRKKLLPHTR